ncbi:hypothetical protein DFS34DRAFT_75198 [Phlyctochytrium arcticum]|nr:hypothetical protein DFS34DRAFT_75198 [Phlyctochytrium arcticum]
MPIKPREGLADKHLLIDADNVRQQQDWDRLFSGLRKRPNDVLAWRVLSRGPAEADIAAKGHAYGQRINKSSHRSQNSVPSYQQPKHYPSRRVPPLLASPKLVYDLVRLTKFIAIQSTTLTEIEIAGVPLSLDMVKVLAEGIYHGGQMIRRFSLARGQIGDEGLKLLAPGLKTLLSLTILNLGACSLTEKSAVVLSDVLNGRAVKRQAAIWECTLRSRAGPPYDRGVNPAIAFRSNNLIASTNASIVTEGVYPGDAGVVAPLSSGALIIRGKVVPAAIKRLCLPHNDFGDEGVHTLMESLVEETGLAALDLPCNGITDLGARIVEQVLHLNKELQVVDLRSNFVSSEMWDMVCRRLCENRGTELQVVSATGEWADITRVKTTDPEVKWLPPTDPLRFSYYQAVVDAKSGRSKSRFRPTFSKNAKLVKKPVPVGARPPFKVGPAPVQGWGHHNAGPAQYAKFQLRPPRERFHWQLRPPPRKTSPQKP